VSGTAAETYLRGRGIDSAIPESIRFASLRYGKTGREHPCLIALAASVDNKAVGLHRIYLKPDGSGKADVPKSKLSLGQIAGAAIRLAPCAASMVVCEGIEDGLTLQQELGQAVWAAAGASMLPSMQLPAGVMSVTVAADNDAAGQRSAKAAAGAFSLDGRNVRIIRPLPGHKDFNDELRGVRA
jgi:DNA primase